MRMAEEDDIRTALDGKSNQKLIRFVDVVCITMDDEDIHVPDFCIGNTRVMPRIRVSSDDEDRKCMVFLVSVQIAADIAAVNEQIKRRFPVDDFRKDVAGVSVRIGNDEDFSADVIHVYGSPPSDVCNIIIIGQRKAVKKWLHISSQLFFYGEGRWPVGIIPWNNIVFAFSRWPDGKDFPKKKELLRNRHCILR